jgi:TPR repeat protein
MMLKRILIILALLAVAFSPAFAGFDEGKKAYEKKDYAAAIKELRPLAETGDDRAMVILANMYEGGFGIIPSRKEALDLYKRAATEKNNTQAMNAMGAIYISALGVEQNLQTALAWLHRSAMLGDQTGAFLYATLLFEGNKNEPNKLTPDLPEAYKWFRIAASEKQSPTFQAYAAKMAQGLAGKMLLGDQVAKAAKEAAAWKPVDVESLGPVPADPPQLVPAPTKNSSPPSAAPDKPLPHSEPLQK